MVLPKCQDCKKKHKINGQLNIVCQLCNDSKEGNSVFPCQEKLDKHLILRHKEILEKKSSDKSDVVNKSKSSTNNFKGVHERKKSLTCKHCKTDFCNEVELKQHIDSEHKIPCDVCNKKFFKSTIKRHIKSQHEEKNKDIASVHGESPLISFCNVCNKEFAGPETLKIHKRTHTCSDSVHEPKHPEFSVPNIKLSWDSEKKTVKNDKVRVF